MDTFRIESSQLGMHRCLSSRFVSFRFVSFRFVSFRFFALRHVASCHVSSRNDNFSVRYSMDYYFVGEYMIDYRRYILFMFSA